MPMTIDDALFDALAALSQPGLDLVSHLNNSSSSLSRETETM